VQCAITERPNCTTERVRELPRGKLPKRSKSGHGRRGANSAPLAPKVPRVPKVPKVPKVLRAESERTSGYVELIET